MIDQIKITEIDDSCKLHMMKSKKFKTIILGLYVRRPLRKEEASQNALISRLLDQGTENYDNFQSLNQKLETLYGSVIVLDVHKYGDEQMIQYKLQMPNGKFVQDDNLLKDGIKIFNEIVNHPFTEEGGFSKSIFEREKKNLIDEIETRKDDKMMHVVDMCIEKMFEEDIYSLHEYGTREDVEAIDRKALYEHYKKILKTSPLDICIIGDIDFEEAEKAIQEIFVINREKIEKPKKSNYTLAHNAVKEVVEKHEVNQGKLALGYDTQITYDADDYYASVVMANILGGGSHSKFFVNIREKESLCYYIYARIEKFKSLMIVSAGVAFEDYDKAVSLIKEEIKKIQNGDFSDQDIAISKKTMIDSIRSISDYGNSYMNYYYGNLICNRPHDIDQIIDNINQVTHEEIVKASQKLRLDTIGFIDSTKSKRGDE